MMKKALVYAMAMALGVSATAFAANPFSDVPAGHWAYASIAKLAAAGVVDGYPDGTFKGDRTMTRFEMAQIVAKALAKGAIGADDKLVGEFADELDNLGVRVAKLEKKSDNVKISGNIRYNYQDVKASNPGSHDYYQNLRSRMWFTGTINDNWNYVGMLQNIQDFTTDNGTSDTEFQRAYLEGNIGAVKVTAGRQDFTLVDGNLYDTRMDGIKAEVGSKVKFGAYFGKPTDQDGWFSYARFWGVNANTDIGKLNLSAGYDKFSKGYERDTALETTNLDNMPADENGIWNVGAKYNFGDASLGAIFLKSNINEPTLTSNTNKGLVVTGTLKGADSSKPGSWGLWGKYYNQGYGTVIAHTMNGYYSDNGFQGWGAGLNVTLAKNMVAGFEYYNLNSKGYYKSYRTLWSELVVNF
jgi:hypothetical protein